MAAGRHRLRVRTDWQCGREVEVDLRPDDEVIVEGAVPPDAARFTCTFLRPGQALEFDVVRNRNSY